MRMDTTRNNKSMRSTIAKVLVGFVAVLIVFSGACFFPLYRWISSVGAMGAPVVGHIQFQLNGNWFVAGQSESILGHLVTSNATRPMLLFVEKCGCFSESPAKLYVFQDIQIASPESQQRLCRCPGDTQYQWQLFRVPNHYGRRDNHHW